MTTHAHVYVSGRVQGVGFRANTRREASSRGVTGWVKNLEDGRVEAVFEGDEEAVDDMIEWVHDGPRTARVSEVEVDRGDPDGYSDFTIRR
ncbi:MAG: acylphosphatase [Halobacteriaceae archaeon]